MNIKSLPSGWKRTRLKYLGKIIMGQAPSSDTVEELTEDLLPFIQGTAEFSNIHPVPKQGCSSPSKVARRGDLLISVRAPVGELNIADQDYGIGRGLCAVEFLELDQRFGWYAIHHYRKQLNEVSTGSTYEAVAVSDVGNIVFKTPPFLEQQRIGNYLDRETAQIDELINEKDQMLKLLAEKRTALITHAVTRGLEQTAPMRPSGHEWLGDVPAHWKVKRSKQVLREHDERSNTGKEELLTVSHITGVTKRSEKEVYMFEAESTEGYKLCSPGNLVINTLWAWMGAMGIAWEPGIVSPAYHVYQLSPELLPGYVDALVRTPVFAKEVIRFSKGVWSSRLRLYPEGLYEVRLPVPPLDEQQQIIDAISNDRKQTAEMEAALIQSIELLKERRSALITDAVTGQIKAEAMSL